MKMNELQLLTAEWISLSNIIMSKELRHGKYSISQEDKAYKVFKEKKIDSGILYPFIHIWSIKSGEMVLNMQGFVISFIVTKNPGH